MLADAAAQNGGLGTSPADVVRLVPVPAPEAERRARDVDVHALGFGLTHRQPAHDPVHVSALAEVFPRLPPIVVHATTLEVIDGVHRVLAARSLGRPTIRAVLFPGSLEDASILAAHCNIAHGKPLGRRERQEAATKVLRLHPEWSDRRIADICGLSPKTIGRIRVRAGEDIPHLTSRVGRDGRARPADPDRVRRRIAEALREDPGASIRQIAARTGAAQGTVRDVRARGIDRDDPAYRTGETGAEFTRWFDAHLVRTDSDWEALVPAVPVGRVYEVADAARACADSWRRLAAAMEARADRRRR